MSIKSWVENVKSVINPEEKAAAVKARDDARTQIYPLCDKYEMPNQELEQQIGVSICGVEYCPEDWLGSPVGSDHPDNVSKKCNDFEPKGSRCVKTECPVYAAHCAYFDAKDAYKDVVAARKNKVRRIFGIREK